MQARKKTCRCEKNIVILWRNKYLTTTLTTFRGNRTHSDRSNECEIRTPCRGKEQEI